MVERTVAEIVTPLVTNWDPAIVSPKHVNLPPWKPIKSGEWMDYVIETTSLVTPEMAERMIASQEGTVYAIQKFVQTVESSGDLAQHHCIIEIGIKYTDPLTGVSEYYIEYNYRTIGGNTISLGIDFNLHNMPDNGEENAMPYNIKVGINIKKPPLPPFPDKYNEENLNQPLEILNADYAFDDQGVYDSLVFTGAKGEYKNVYAVLSSHLRNEDYELFKSLFRGVDIAIQKLNGLKTLENLINNINSTNPENPLKCLVFFPEGE